MAFDVALGADATRRRNDSEALEPAQAMDDGFAHGAPTVHRTSSATISTETVKPMSGPAMDRAKMNMAAPFANENTHSRLPIPEPGSIIGENSPPWAAMVYLSLRRRLEISLLLQQTVISAKPDGTIAAPRFLEPGEATFREIAPDLWREVGGTREFALRNVDGVKTVIDSEDPTSVFQPVPFLRSAPLNLTILLASLAILAVTVILWPIRALVRRRYGRSADPKELRRLRRWVGAAVVFVLLYVVAWIVLLSPVISLELWVYSTRLDPVVRGSQIAGLLVIAAAAMGVWSLWRIARLRSSRMVWVRNSALAAALLGIVWIGFVGKLFSFNLNY